MKKRYLILLFLLLISADVLFAQCSICTRTVQQMGEKPARGLNTGIIYLAFTPLILFAVITWQWLKRNRGTDV
ncbi:MAG: hypothetical protein ACJ75F_07315 [Flavisolibacter sp.]|jgi:hypothetical protein